MHLGKFLSILAAVNITASCIAHVIDGRVDRSSGKGNVANA